MSFILHDYIKQKYQENPKLCSMETYSVIIHFKTENFYKDVYDVEKRFGKSNDEVNRLLPTRKNKKSDWINKI